MMRNLKLQKKLCEREKKVQKQPLHMNRNETMLPKQPFDKNNSDRHFFIGMT